MGFIDSAALFLPLVSAFVVGFCGRFLGDKGTQLFSCACMGVAALTSLVLFNDVALSGAFRTHVFASWITVGKFTTHWAARLDTLSALMVFVVNVVSFLVHVYAVGYMRADKSVPRFMAYLSLFTFFMLALVVANDFMQMFFGWEGVGLASYLLIGFWVERPKANDAAIKAFIVNRIGDFGFLLGLFGTAALFGSLDFDVVVPGAVKQFAEKTYAFKGIEFHALTVLSLLFFLGAMAKSAQIGLHVWLPDAMEGPTPVSALIHAATMVTAGVFMLARLSPLFEAAPDARIVVALVGAVTALFAASIAMTQFDIKKVIAYSTMSQLGYMVFAAGVSAYGAAMFHLVTHAFFKALLFLAAGSVIHALDGEQDMRKMGGLARRLPMTYAFMLIGTFALSGLPPFSGFYSKDLILHAAFQSGTWPGLLAFGFGLVAAAMTAFYAWRLVLLTFHCPAEENRPGLHESPWIMLGPLVPLAVGALAIGAVGHDLFASASNGSFWRASIAGRAVAQEGAAALTLLPTFFALTGTGLAFLFYVKKPHLPGLFVEKLGPVHRVTANRYYFDEIYATLFIAPFRLYATAMRRKRASFDAVYDFLFVRVVQRLGAFLWNRSDDALIDRLGADGVALISKRIGAWVQKTQTGYLGHYALAMAAGLLGCAFWALRKGL